MKKKIMALLLAASIFHCGSMVSAEQAKADEYRKIFESGNYYLEYKESGIKKLWQFRMAGGCVIKQILMGEDLIHYR